MKYIEAPEEYVYQNGDGYCHFLAGGIKNCPDWQTEALEMLKLSDLVIFNPRRKIFSNDPQSAIDQITWEHNHLRKAHAIIFWFPCETNCPITLYELGAWSMKGTKPIYVGVHPDYPKRLDVEVQTKLVRPNVKIVYSLENLIKQVLTF